MQLAIASFFSILSMMVGKYVFKMNINYSNADNINDRMAPYINTEINIVLQDSTNGISKVQISGTYWRILKAL